MSDKDSHFLGKLITYAKVGDSNGLSSPFMYILKLHLLTGRLANAQSFFNGGRT